MKKVLIVLFLSFIFITNVKAEDLGLTEGAKSSILIEASTGEIIHESNANERYAPASMTKIMSLILIMNHLLAVVHYYLNYHLKKQLLMILIKNLLMFMNVLKMRKSLKQCVEN